MSRWGAFIAALVVSASLAVGLGIGLSHALAAAPSAPALHTVRAGTLTRAGISLSALRQPPYCRLSQGAPPPGSPGPEWAKCAVSRQQAESALLPAYHGTVTEAVLARASGPPESGLAGGRPVWLVVVQIPVLTQPVECDQPIESGMACGWIRSAHANSTLVVVVDATSGDVITTITTSPEG